MKLSTKMMFLWRQKTVKSNETNLQVLLKDERRTCLGLMTPERTTEGKNQSLNLENNLKGKAWGGSIMVWGSLDPQRDLKVIYNKKDQKYQFICFKNECLPFPVRILR